MSGLQSSPICVCEGKLGHPTKAAALIVLKRMQKRGGVKLPQGFCLAAYRCGCGAFHIGSMAKDKRT